ncbi:hypothetical protein [Nonomuraea sp. NPDC005692]|uniref:hypothetical protein n=1 Tax=Nonomuraea sp. NPDC005692 TaxID=3157168 RepID=UPI0033DE9089
MRSWPRSRGCSIGRGRVRAASWSCVGIIVPPGYTDPVQFRSGNPYGASRVAGDGPPAEVTLQAAGHQARRVAETAAALKAGRR